MPLLWSSHCKALNAAAFNFFFKIKNTGSCKVDCALFEMASSSKMDDIITSSDTSSQSDGIFLSSDDDAIFLSSESEDNVESEDNADSDTSSINVSSTKLGDCEEVVQILASKCCEKLCVRNLTVNDILFAKNKYMSMSNTEKRQWLADKISDSTSFVAESIIETKYLLAGKEVCKNTFCQVFKLSPKRLRQLAHSVSLRHYSFPHGNQGKKRNTIRVDEAKAWMDIYFNLIGDKLPDKNKIHLPSWDTQKNIYQRYKDDMLEKGML